MNRPTFSSCASWHLSATTFADFTLLDNPGYVYIDANNTIYLPSTVSKIFIWHEGDTNPFLNLTTTSTTSVSVFAARSGEVFAGILNTMNASRLHKWAVNATTSTLFASTATLSYGLFIDDADRLYYSLDEAFIVMRIALDGSLNSTVAGTGTAGTSSTQLTGPAGIFVTTTYNLYVADFGNNRIQMFPSGQMTATTVAGVSAPGTITLAGPKGVVLDAD